jgi:hypothetical protein
MDLPRREIPKTGIEQVEEQFRTWRRTRGKRCAIPDRLWQAAESLYPEYSVYHISKALRLNYTDLKQRIVPKQSTELSATVTKADFIELDLSDSMSPAECVVEMQDSTGSKMRMHFTGRIGVDLLELGKVFWSKTS